MVDPMSALGLAANVISLVDFSVKTVAACHALYKSADGTLPSHNDLSLAYENLPNLLDELRVSLADVDTANNSMEDKALLAISDRCIETVNDLQSLLRELKLQKPGNKWKALKKTIKSSRFKGKLHQVETTLNRYRQELDTELLFDLRRRLIFSQHQDSQAVTDLSVRHNQILAALVDNQSVFTQASFSLQNLITQLNQSVHDEQVASRNQYQYEYEKTRNHVTSAIADLKLADTNEHTWTRDHITSKFSRLDFEQTNQHQIRRVLDSLYFPEINRRREQIANIHPETCQWIFKRHKKQAKRGNLSYRSWDEFSPWLSEGSGIYWIQGKPGAGKSTLMNYICDDARTHKALKKWAHPSPLVIVTFFFWSSGINLQKNISGMLRSILYQLVEAEPKTYKLLCSEADSGQMVWTERELRESLQRVLNHPNMTAKRVCFFIDGLDEFCGNWTDLITIFCTNTQSQRSKACVSSRSYNLFQNAFGSGPQLKLQDFTWPDIWNFTSDKLSNASSIMTYALAHEEIQDLTRTICMKAEGVFLWVDLAVKSLIRGIANLDNYWILQKRLDLLPPELNGLYTHFLDNVEPMYQHWTTRYLFYAILLVDRKSQLGSADEVTRKLCAALKTEMSVSWLQLAFLDFDFSSAESMDNISINDVLRRCIIVHSRLNASCFGLLDIVRRVSRPKRRHYKSNTVSQRRIFKVLTQAELEFSHATASTFVMGYYSKDDFAKFKAKSSSWLVQMCIAVMASKVWQIRNLDASIISKLYPIRDSFLTSVGAISSTLQILDKLNGSDPIASRKDRIHIQTLRTLMIDFEKLLGMNDTWQLLCASWKYQELEILEEESADPENDFLSYLTRHHPSQYIMERLPEYALSPMTECKNKATYLLLLTLDPEFIQKPFDNHMSLAFDLLNAGADPMWQITDPKHHGDLDLALGLSGRTAWDFFLKILELELHNIYCGIASYDSNPDMLIGRVAELFFLKGCNIHRHVRGFFATLPFDCFTLYTRDPEAFIVLEASALQIMRWQAKPWSLQIASKMKDRGAMAEVSVLKYNHISRRDITDPKLYGVGPSLVDELTQRLYFQGRHVFREIFESYTEKIQSLLDQVQKTGIPHPDLEFIQRIYETSESEPDDDT